MKNMESKYNQYCTQIKEKLSPGHMFFPLGWENLFLLVQSVEWDQTAHVRGLILVCVLHR